MRAFRLGVLVAATLVVARDVRSQEESEDAAPAPVAAQVGPPATATAEERATWLRETIDRAVASHPELSRARIAIHVVDVDTGRELYARAANDPFNVASNVKVVTVAAALAALGPEYRFRTTLHAEGWDRRDRVRGDLYLRAGGDPTLVEEDLAAIADEIVKLGVRKIDGALVIDDGFFDGEITPPAFAQKKEDSAFRAPVSAASFNYNAVAVRIQPGAASGDPAQVALSPPSAYVELTSSIVTVDEGRTRIDAVAKVVPGKPARLAIEVAGTVRAGTGVTWVRKRVDDPVEYLGESLRAMLAARGVKIGSRRLERRAVPAAAEALVLHSSAPLGVLVRDLNKYSNNFMAETVLKTLAAERRPPGTWKEGVAAVREWLAAAGVRDGSYRYDNGSGLYESNRFSAAQITTVLRAGALDFRIAPELVASLSIAGGDGTLRSRMTTGPARGYVRAKTGTLRNVTCLTGFAGAPGTRAQLAFAVLVNEIPEKVEGAGKAARALQDEVAEALVLYLGNYTESP